VIIKGSAWFLAGNSSKASRPRRMQKLWLFVEQSVWLKMKAMTRLSLPQTASLVYRLKSLEMDRSSVGLLVDGIKGMTNSFMSVSFIHVKCNLNEAAHILAKLCGSCTSSEVFYSILDCIRRTLLY
jgi:hypothetical protein